MERETITARLAANLEHLKNYTATPGKGCSRLPFSRETRQAADYLKAIMEEAGLAVREDVVGNVFGVLPGKDSAKPCVMVGSHYDSVYNGGDYDGIGGVICAVELARLLRDTGIVPEQDFVVAAFMDEEGCRFGNGYFGSKCMLGQITLEECRRLTDKDGITIWEAMESYGLDPERIPEARWEEGRIGHYIELHIEQGPVLEAEQTELGLVDCIVGIRRFMVHVQGQADHAGTTPMDMRHDPVTAAARVIAQIPEFARAEEYGTVSTVGFMRSNPGAINVVADSVDFSIDIRASREEILDRLCKKIRNALDEACAAAHTAWEAQEKLRIVPVQLSAPMLDCMEASCARRGYSCRRMPSGAGHDALAIGQSIDTVMIFVPSKGGRSHCPEEFTPYTDFTKAVEVLYDLVLSLVK